MLLLIIVNQPLSIVQPVSAVFSDIPAGSVAAWWEKTQLSSHPKTSSSTWEATLQTHPMVLFFARFVRNLLKENYRTSGKCSSNPPSPFFLRMPLAFFACRRLPAKIRNETSWDLRMVTPACPKPPGRIPFGLGIVSARKLYIEARVKQSVQHAYQLLQNVTNEMRRGSLLTLYWLVTLKSCSSSAGFKWLTVPRSKHLWSHSLWT